MATDILNESAAIVDDEDYKTHVEWREKHTVITPTQRRDHERMTRRLQKIVRLAEELVKRSKAAVKELKTPEMEGYLEPYYLNHLRNDLRGLAYSTATISGLVDGVI